MRNYCIYLKPIHYRNWAPTHNNQSADMSANMKRLTKNIASSLTACLMGACLSNTSVAENYYQWVDEAGITHYGSAPPAGITAKKIKSSGKTAPSHQTTNPTVNHNDSLASKKTEERKKELLVERQAQCAQEKERLQTLTARGRRIRMEDESGNSRYLNAEELAKEISTSEQFLQEACK